jgi:hypothetical protein
VGKSNGTIGSWRFPGEEGGKGATDDLTATHDDGMFAYGRNFTKAKNLYNSCGRAGQETRGIAKEEFSEIDRVESVDVLCGRDPSIDNVVGEG